MEVGVGAQLREDAEREHLHAAAEEVVGGERLVAHLAEVLERGSDMSIMTCVAISGTSSMSSSTTYHHVASRNCASSLSGRKLSGCLRRPVP